MNSPFEIFHSIDELDINLWNSKIHSTQIFLNAEFLQVFEINLDLDKILPFYICFKNGIIYGHLIRIEGKKVANYINNKKYSIKKQLLRNIGLRFFCFGNTHLSNISSNSFQNRSIKEEDLNLLIAHISKKYKINFFLLPDHFIKSLEKKPHLFLSSEFNIDPDMVLKLDSKWTSFNDYSNAVVSKYKKRIRKVFKDSSFLEMKKIASQNIKALIPNLQKLYLNVHAKSSFSGPALNLKTYIDFANYSKIEFSLYVYSLNNQMVGFSSEFYYRNTLYSYFIGLDYTYNKKFSVYNRILYDSIKHGIDKKVSQIVYGRTAAEFKSTIGAVPIKSKSAIYITNKFLRAIIYPFIKNLSPRNWEQRNPFKIKTIL